MNQHAPAPGSTWTERLWQEVDPIYDAILEHPFLRGLTDGTLPEARFAYYLAQDSHYLSDYARALVGVGAKAPNHALTATFGKHAAESVAVELALHERLLPELGIDPRSLHAVPVSPTTTAYTSYLVATVSSGSFAEGLAAVLPCFWIYQRVGEDLISKGSSNPRFQRWIDTYADEAFAATVAEVLSITNEAGTLLTPEQQQAAGARFVTAARYEWMFWDAAWRQEQWPV